MKARLRASIVCISGLIAISGHADAAEADAAGTVKLSPGLAELLRAEMREISGGVQAIPLFIAVADWKSIEETAAKIRASYIMEKKLTPAQSAELQKALPAGFKQLDTQFHRRAEKMGAAAAAHDAELVTFQYSRLLESCVVCHSQYAKSRFPAFSTPAEQAHHH